MLAHVRFIRQATRSLSVPVLLAGLLIFGITVLPTQVASAGGTNAVTNCSGSASSVGSFPYEVSNSGSGATITFSVNCPSSSSINISGRLTISQNLTIDGPGNGLVVINGQNSQGGFYIPGPSVSFSGISFEGTQFYSDAGGTLVLANCFLTNLSGINIEDGNTVIEGSTVTNSQSGYGGAVMAYYGTLNVIDSTLSNNTAITGGAIDDSGGDVTVVDSTLSGNTAANGGAIATTYGGTLAVSNSTLYGNTSTGSGGGAIGNDAGTVSVTQATIAGNTAPSGANSSGLGGGGIFSNSGTVSVTGTILAKNGPAGNCSGLMTDSGSNLDDDGTCAFSSANNSISGQNAELGSLANNGGPTETIGLKPNSPAIDVVSDSSLCSTLDQRGVSRPTPCDMGAVQLTLPPAPVIASFSPTKGPWGTKVTIYGSNLSNAISVTFNGTSATISRDTATKLIVRVPNGALTGKITVSTPGDSVTSTKNFKVT